MFKRFLALTLALLMLASVALADYESEYYIPPKINEGQYPFVDDGSITLDYWMSINRSAVSWIADNDENLAWQKAQEVTGVDINFTHPAVGTEAESFQTMVIGELPDLIQCSYSTYPGGLTKMYDDGIIIDLTPYLEEYAPSIWRFSSMIPTLTATRWTMARSLAFTVWTMRRRSPITARFCARTGLKSSAWRAR